MLAHRSRSAGSRRQQETSEATRQEARYPRRNDGETDSPRIWTPKDSAMSSLENHKKIAAEMEFSGPEISFKPGGSTPSW